MDGLVTAVEPSAAEAVLAQPEMAERLQQAAGVLRSAPVISMTDVLATMCEQMHCTFSLRAQDMPAAEVMSPEMFLPAVAWTIQEQGYALLGGNLGCSLRVDPDGSLLGAVARIPPLTASTGDLIRGLFAIHFATALFGLRADTRIELEPLYQSLRPSFERLLRTHQVSPEGEIQWQPTDRPT